MTQVTFPSKIEFYTELVEKPPCPQNGTFPFHPQEVPAWIADTFAGKRLDSGQIGNMLCNTLQAYVRKVEGDFVFYVQLVEFFKERFFETIIQDTATRRAIVTVIEMRTKHKSF